MSANAPSEWRTWLRETRLPFVRQFVQMVRLYRRLRQLGRMQEELETLQRKVPLLQEAFDTLQGSVSSLQGSVSSLRGSVSSLRDKTGTLNLLHDHLYDQVDLLKSAQEVPPDWYEEFQSWKRENPIPENPLVSVCVATWNRAKLLTERCLPSLLRQTYTNLEINVVGDGCTDGTEKRIAALGDRRIRFVNLPQRGRYPQESRRRWMVAGSIPMNHALSMCSGEFITHLDDDDEHVPERVERLVSFAIEKELDFIWHPFWWESRPGQWDLKSSPEFRVSQVTTSSIFYRRWLSRIGWDVNAHLLAEPGDWNRLRKLIYLGVKSARYPEPLLYHYLEGTTIQATAA